MANKRPVIDNPLEDMDITNIVRSITSEGVDAPAKSQDDEAESQAPAPKQKAAKRPAKAGRGHQALFHPLSPGDQAEENRGHHF